MKYSLINQACPKRLRLIVKRTRLMPTYPIHQANGTIYPLKSQTQTHAISTMRHSLCHSMVLHLKAAAEHNKTNSSQIRTRWPAPSNNSTLKGALHSPSLPRWRSKPSPMKQMASLELTLSKRQAPAKLSSRK